MHSPFIIIIIEFTEGQVSHTRHNHSKLQVNAEMPRPNV